MYAHVRPVRPESRPCTPWAYMGVHGRTLGVQCTPTNFFVRPQKNGFCQQQCTPTNFFVRPCTPIYFYVRPCTPMYAHVRPCTPMYAQVRPCTPMYAHVSQQPLELQGCYCNIFFFIYFEIKVRDQYQHQSIGSGANSGP